MLRLRDDCVNFIHPVVGVLCGGFCSQASPTTALSHPMRKKATLIYSSFIKFS